LLETRSRGAVRGATLTKRLLAFARRQELKLEAVEVEQLVPDMWISRGNLSARQV
jgi:hypothetical protein